MTKADVLAAFEFTAVLGQAIAAAGPQGIPSGHLYAAVMGKCTIEAYEGAIRALKRSGIVIESDSHVLTINLKESL